MGSKSKKISVPLRSRVMEGAALLSPQLASSSSAPDSDDVSRSMDNSVPTLEEMISSIYKNLFGEEPEQEVIGHCATVAVRGNPEPQIDVRLRILMTSKSSGLRKEVEPCMPVAQRDSGSRGAFRPNSRGP
ncbi:Hypothetical predicted protein [Pelobates cultripes]|uniref:Uncharacterized protein n=1 Tax=Pelobates cultripes TaxID=61616 RepID=A0AAD1RX39_PELCU|nr:Hypothetical predicted protein [Pelobates cultripes]